MALGGAGSPELASCQRHHLQDDCTSSGASGPGGGAGHGRGQNSAFAQSSDSSALQAGQPSPPACPKWAGEMAGLALARPVASPSGLPAGGTLWGKS